MTTLMDGMEKMEAGGQENAGFVDRVALLDAFLQVLYCTLSLIDSVIMTPFLPTTVL